MREKVKFALMECNGGDDTCFCVSMGTNKTDDYSLALKFSDEGVQVQVTDEAFAPYFAGMPQAGYTPAFVEENELKVTVPDLDDKAVCLALKSHPMWKEFDGRCISCGACTVACSTCPCLTTRDVIYGDNPEVGERRRVPRVERWWGQRGAGGLGVGGHTLAAGGWVKEGGDLFETMKFLDSVGCSRYVVTDVARDGMMSGPNIELLREVASRTDAKVTASGGISKLDDLRNIKELAELGVDAAILGKSLYARAFTLEEALELAR